MFKFNLNEKVFIKHLNVEGYVNQYFFQSELGNTYQVTYEGRNSPRYELHHPGIMEYLGPNHTNIFVFEDQIEKIKPVLSEQEEATLKLMEDNFKNIVWRLTDTPINVMEEIQRVTDLYESIYAHPVDFGFLDSNSKNAIPENKACDHVWLEYIGITNKFDYCSKCDEKR